MWDKSFAISTCSHTNTCNTLNAVWQTCFLAIKSVRGIMPLVLHRHISSKKDLWMQQRLWDHDYDIMKERKAVYWVTWVRLILMSFYSNKSIFSYSAASSPKVSHRNLNHIYYMYIFTYSFLTSIGWTNRLFFVTGIMSFFFFFTFLRIEGVR